MNLFIEIHTPDKRLSVRALEDLLAVMMRDLHAECMFIQEGPPDVRSVLVVGATHDGLTCNFVSGKLTTLASPPPGWIPAGPTKERLR